MTNKRTNHMESLIWLFYPGQDTFNSPQYLNRLTNAVKALYEGSEEKSALSILVLNGKPEYEEHIADVIRGCTDGETTPSVRFIDSYLCRHKSKDLKEADDECYHNLQADCTRKFRLLFIDENGNAFSCYGAWIDYKNGNCELPNQEAMIQAYQNGVFHSLCVECLYAHKDDRWRYFPCARYGCTAKSSLWGEQEHNHLQFGDQNDRCQKFKPVFELSLEQSRTRLEKLLFRDGFWRNALLDPNKSLEEYWPTTDNKNPKVRNIIPIFGDYPFDKDSASKLDELPANNYFPHEPHHLKKCQEMFLPICFLPHLRVLFELHREVSLVSVILTDPRPDSDLDYRSLFRDGPNGPQCFEDNIWQDIWRLPNTWHEWKDTILNLSSAIRNDRKNGHQTLEEYVVVLKPGNRKSRNFGKPIIDFSWLQGNRTIIKDRSVKEFVQTKAQLVRNSIDKNHIPSEYFLDPWKEPDNSIGVNVWNECFAAMHKGPKTKLGYEYIHFNPTNNTWFQCFSENVSDLNKSTIGCKLLNYLIWLEAVFSGEISAIESFNAISSSNKQPSQFVVFSHNTLESVARAQFKLTLTTLMQPIESAYALEAEVQRNVLSVKETAFRNAGHIMKNRTIAPQEALSDIYDLNAQ
ncbi:MAG: hypothetical protein MIO92_00885, partial [Methanosarcinaceae archaeon]|nr:hypothetical protein [Methanosarcinaceae archaeon]